MARLWYTFSHVALSTSVASGVGSSSIAVGEMRDGQLVVYRASAGVGAWLRVSWESSADGVHWGPLLVGATLLAATGVQILSAVGGIGNYARARWRQSPTANRFGITFVLKE